MMMMVNTAATLLFYFIKLLLCYDISLVNVVKGKGNDIKISQINAFKIPSEMLS